MFYITGPSTGEPSIATEDMLNTGMYIRLLSAQLPVSLLVAPLLTTSNRGSNDDGQNDALDLV